MLRSTQDQWSQNMKSVLPALDRPMTVGELVRCATSVPQEAVLGLIPEIVGRLEKLADTQDRGAYVRHLIVLGALVSRGVYEICDVPKNERAAVI